MRQRTQIESLSRSALLLHRNVGSDYRALENAPDAVGEAVGILKDAGMEEAWMEEENH